MSAITNRAESPVSMELDGAAPAPPKSSDKVADFARGQFENLRELHIAMVAESLITRGEVSPQDGFTLYVEECFHHDLVFTYDTPSELCDAVKFAQQARTAVEMCAEQAGSPHDDIEASDAVTYYFPSLVEFHIALVALEIADPDMSMDDYITSCTENEIAPTYSTLEQLNDAVDAVETYQNAVDDSMEEDPATGQETDSPSLYTEAGMLDMMAQEDPEMAVTSQRKQRLKRKELNILADLIAANPEVHPLEIFTQYEIACFSASITPTLKTYAQANSAIKNLKKHDLNPELSRWETDDFHLLHEVYNDTKEVTAASITKRYNIRIRTEGLNLPERQVNDIRQLLLHSDLLPKRRFTTKQEIEYIIDKIFPEICDKIRVSEEKKERMYREYTTFCTTKDLSPTYGDPQSLFTNARILIKKSPSEREKSSEAREKKAATDEIAKKVSDILQECEDQEYSNKFIINKLKNFDELSNTALTYLNSPKNSNYLRKVIDHRVRAHRFLKAKK